MLSPKQVKQEAENREAEESAQAAEQRKQHQEGWRKTISRVNKKAEENKEDVEKKEDWEAEQIEHFDEIHQAVEEKVMSFFGWVKSQSRPSSRQLPVKKLTHDSGE